MHAIHTPTDPCAERSIAARVAMAADSVDADTTDTAVVAFPPLAVRARRPVRTERIVRTERRVRLIQHPSFLRTADRGPDPRFTLAGRAPRLVQGSAQAASRERGLDDQAPSRAAATTRIR